MFKDTSQVIANFIMGLLLLAVLALPFMYVWNITLPALVDHVHEISYWQAAGLLILAEILHAHCKISNKSL